MVVAATGTLHPPGETIAFQDKKWLRHAARVVLAGGILIFVGMLLRRELDNGWAGIFAIGNGKLDIIPLAIAILLVGLTYGKKGLRFAAQIVVIGVVFLYLGRAIHHDWSQITGREWDFSIPWMAVSFIFLFGLYVCHSSGWLLILRRFDHGVKHLPGTFVWSKSLLARYVPGNVLMVVGRIMMIEPFGVPKRISLTTIVYEQSLLATGCATVVSVALPLWPSVRTLSPVIPVIGLPVVWLILLLPPLAITGLHPAVLGKVGNFLLAKTGREPIEEFLPFRTVLAFVLYYCFTWSVAGMGLFSLLRSVTAVGITGLPVVIASVPLAWLLAMIVFVSPSGIGVRELVYASTLAFAFNHEAGVASAFAILARLWQTMIEVSFALVVMTLVKKFYPGSGKEKPEAIEALADEAAEDPAKVSANTVT